MAERYNLAIITAEKTIFYESKWGGYNVWEFLLKGRDYTFDIYTNLQFEPDFLQTGCDGAILIDEINMNLIFYQHFCSFDGLNNEKNNSNENEKVISFIDRVSFLDSDSVYSILHPNFIEFLRKIAIIFWSGYNIYLARYEDFLDQVKFEFRIDKIPSINFHLDYHLEFPELSETEIVKNLKLNFNNDDKAFYHLEQYERSKLP